VSIKAGTENSDLAIAVMVKPPLPGSVKTRLTPPLAPAEAAGLYRVFIADIFTTLEGLEAPAARLALFVAAAPPAGPADFQGLVPSGVGFFLQQGAGLGDRIYSVFKGLEERGYARAIVIGSDSPDMPSRLICEACSALSDPEGDIVLGPAEDGGYYLIGASLPIEEVLFRDIPWSGPTVLEETLKRARKAGLALRLLETWHDIDRPADLAFLLGGQGAPKSRAFLEALGQRAALASLLKGRATTTKTGA
jgi:hypothetical protein